MLEALNEQKMKYGVLEIADQLCTRSFQASRFALRDTSVQEQRRRLLHLILGLVVCDLRTKARTPAIPNARNGRHHGLEASFGTDEVRLKILCSPGCDGSTGRILENGIFRRLRHAPHVLDRDACT